MSIERVRTYLRHWGRENDIIETPQSTSTADLAAQVLNVTVGRIAKSISFKKNTGALLVVASGDVRIDNKKFRNVFCTKASMLSPEDVLSLTGYNVGGVCPFALPKDFPLYLDTSLLRFTSVFPACGSSNSLIEVSIKELEEYSNYLSWIDVCRIK